MKKQKKTENLAFFGLFKYIENRIDFLAALIFTLDKSIEKFLQYNELYICILNDGNVYLSFLKRYEN